MMENAVAAKVSPYAIEFDGCTFCYKGASCSSLRDVSLKIPRGQCVVVTGQSGCGKTTTGRTLLRLYEPTGGRIIYDDKVFFD